MRYTRPNQTPLFMDDTLADDGDFGLSHAPKSLSHNGPVLTRSIERPAVRAGIKCPRCIKGSMFLEWQIRGDPPERVCKSCGCNEASVSLPALLELAGEEL